MNNAKRKYRFIAIDVDDTLLTDDLTVTEGTKKALREAVRQGCIVTLATGRMYASAVKIAGQLGLNVPIITYQGALIKNLLDGGVLYERLLPEDAALTTVEFAKERGLHLQVYDNDRLIAMEDNEKVRMYSEITGVPYEIRTDLAAIAKRGTPKMIIIDEPQVLDALASELAERLGERARLTKSKPFFLEVLHVEATKGHALLHLASHFGIAQEETIAVGDSWNDHEMIEAAGLGVAMANSVDSLKQVADAVTLSNNEEGVRAVVETYLLR